MIKLMIFYGLCQHFMNYFSLFEPFDSKGPPLQMTTQKNLCFKFQRFSFLIKTFVNPSKPFFKNGYY